MYEVTDAENTRPASCFISRRPALFTLHQSLRLEGLRRQPGIEHRPRPLGMYIILSAVRIGRIHPRRMKQFKLEKSAASVSSSFVCTVFLLKKVKIMRYIA